MILFGYLSLAALAAQTFLIGPSGRLRYPLGITYDHGLLKQARSW